MSQAKVSKTINDYREILSEEIDKVRNDVTTPAKINAITNAVGKVLSTVKLEMEYAKLSGTKPNILMLKQSKE